MERRAMGAWAVVGLAAGAWWVWGVLPGPGAGAPPLAASPTTPLDWCAEHGVPESECVACNPDLSPPPETAPAGGTAADAPTEAPRSRRPPSVLCDSHRRPVQLASPRTADDAGLETERLRLRPLRRVVACEAETRYDERLHARLAPRAPGVVQRVGPDLGERVLAGEAVAEMDSAALGEAKAALLSALAGVALWEGRLAQEERLAAREAGLERERLEARTRRTEARIAEARARAALGNLGLSPGEVEAAIEAGETGTTLALRAPFEGVVVALHAAPGETVDAQQPVLEVADTSRMWAILDLREEALRGVEPGQEVVLRLAALPGEAFAGLVTWVGTAVDPRTRTLAARAELENPDGRLRAYLWGSAEVQVRDTETALLVPREAVQWEGCCNLAFVRRGEALFEPRKLRLGWSTGTHFEVLEGLSAGEDVVTTGSFLLKTEVLKSSIGAGCCEADPGAAR